MALKLVDRIVRLMKADAHGVVESLEERSLLLKQYLREAEIELQRKRADLEALQDEVKQLSDLLGRRDNELRSLEDDVEQALAAGRDDLARFAIRRLIPRQREAEALRTQLNERSAACKALSQQLDEQQAQFEALRTRVRAQLARPVDQGAGIFCGGEPGVADEEVELELLRRRTLREGVA